MHQEKKIQIITFFNDRYRKKLHDTDAFEKNNFTYQEMSFVIYMMCFSKKQSNLLYFSFLQDIILY